MLESELIEAMIAEMQFEPQRALGLLEKIAFLPEMIAAQEIIGTTTRQRENGIFYTNFNLARTLINEVIETSENPEGSFLEPCVGGGAFYFAFIESSMQKTGKTLEDLESILHRCFIADNDPIAVDTIRKVAPHFFRAQYGLNAEIPESNIFIGDSLWSNSENSITDFRAIFNMPKGFDFVVTNPPYKLLKADRRQASGSSDGLINFVDSLRSSKAFNFIEGVPNLYKLFVEAIVCRWIADDGTVGLLVPRSLLSDFQSGNLREHILNKFDLGSIFFIPEGSSHFKGVGQAFCMFAAKKGKSTNQIIFAEVPEANQKQIKRELPINLETIRKFSNKSAIHKLDLQGQELLNHLASFQKIGAVPGIVNLRGEFDMTLDAKYLSDSETNFNLIQGQNIGQFRLIPSNKHVEVDFLNRPKGKWVMSGRIACQQISNMNQKRRLKWTYVPQGFVLGNSCNFMALDTDSLWYLNNDMIFYLLGILNSSMMNERFKLLSANNHVSNVEISSFPVGELTAAEVPDIIDASRRLTSTFNLDEYEKLDLLVTKHFGIGFNSRYWEHR